MSADRHPVPLGRRGAVISHCGRYRYTLTRIWDDHRPPLTFLMLNPSVADGMVDDATIRVCMGRALRMGAGGITVANLFAWRATDPVELLVAPDPVGPENDAYIGHAVLRMNLMVIAAWGVGGNYLSRASKVTDLIRWHYRVPLYCLGTTKDGAPRHPLRIAYAVQPTLWRSAV